MFTSFSIYFDPCWLDEEKLKETGEEPFHGTIYCWLKISHMQKITGTERKKHNLFFEQAQSINNLIGISDHHANGRDFRRQAIVFWNLLAGKQWHSRLTGKLPHYSAGSWNFTHCLPESAEHLKKCFIHVSWSYFCVLFFILQIIFVGCP